VVEQRVLQGWTVDAIKVDVASGLASDSVIDVVIELVESGFHKRQICKKVDLCARAPNGLVAKSVTKARKFAGAGLLVKQAPDDVFCDICNDIVDYITELVLNGTIEPVIEELVTELCDVLPWPLSSWCYDFIDQYIQEIIELIEEGAEDICSLIGICATPPRPNGIRVRPAKPKVQAKVQGKVQVPARAAPARRPRLEKVVRGQ
jgi:hypothetical protein